uniref:Telomerase reverse transcriptase n=1 Tax=Panagrolaimus sp. JU765 TaxID=591449 RepID=A0AC34PYV9_9BILA
NLCKKIARAIMNAKAYEPIFDKHLILSGFKYNDMKWLAKLLAKDKIIMGQNFVRFFTYFCMEIVLKHLHCEADSNQLIRFYRKDVWTRIKKYSVEKFIVDRKAVEIGEKDSDYHYFLNFIPKSTTTRPIEVFYDLKTKDELKIINRALIYLIEDNNISTGFGLRSIPKFANILRIFAARNKNDVKEYYCFSGDITNCYPSIRHDILKIALDSIIPRNMILHVGHYFTKYPRARRPKIIIGKSLNEVENLARKSGLVKDHSGIQKIETNKVFEYVLKYAMKSVVKVSGKFYKCHGGISQGSQLSTTLCNIYLAHVENQLFRNCGEDLTEYLYGQKALLFRYIDDYLFISKDQELSSKIILKLLNEADTEYGMKMNSKKIKASNNLSQMENILTKSQYCTFQENSKIPWCGITIDTKNLSISIDSTRYKTKRKRISIKKFNTDEKKIQWIIEKIKSLMKWKLKIIRQTIRIHNTSKERNLLINEINDSIIKDFANYFFKRMRIKYRTYREKIKSLKIFMRNYIRRRRKKNPKKKERIKRKLKLNSQQY